ncbi:MAG: hypothetical protein R3D03_07305 [Geminicoccaceae bacterium]
MRVRSTMGAALLLALAGCGGGGGGHGDSDDFVSPVDAGDVPDLAGAIADGSGFVAPAQATVTGRSSTVVIEQGGSIRIRVPGDTLQRYYTPTSTVSNIETYQSYDASDFLIKNTVGQGFGDSFDLNYVSFGVWAESDVADLLMADDPRIIDAAPFYIAVPTPRNQMPLTGAASYRGGVLGVETDGDRMKAVLVGSINAQADFLRGNIYATATLKERDGGAWGTVTMPDIAINGTKFSSENVTASTGHKGEVNGIFAGPDAQEIAGTMVLKGDTTVRASLAARQY